VIQQALGAIENALLDLKAKALGVPGYELLGEPVRDRIRLYWSHCGTYRLQWSKEMQIPPLRSLQDCVNAGKEVVFWVECDTRDARALHYLRSRTTIPVASCECLFGRRDYRPFLEAQAVDVAIIDTPWNGVAESVKIAATADAYEVNVAPTTSTATWPP
jgi:L-alanine-DL-glutamate epimerase-like enolase superfamily enzyme